MSTHVPPGFSSITPYLMVENADAFLAFLGSTLDGETLQVTREGDAPDGAIVHAEVRVEGSVLEFSEARAPWGATSTCLHLYVADADATLARMIAAGCTELYAATDHAYGERSGGVADAWGTRWFVATMTDVNLRVGGTA